MNVDIVIFSLIYLVLGYVFTVWFTHRFLTDGEYAGTDFYILTNLCWPIPLLVITAFVFAPNLVKKMVGNKFNFTKFVRKLYLWS